MEKIPVSQEIVPVLLEIQSGHQAFTVPAQ